MISQATKIELEKRSIARDGHGKNAQGGVRKTYAPEKTEAPLVAHVIYRLDVGGLENGLVNLINRIPQNRFRHAIICLTDYTDFHSRITKPVQLYALHKREGKDPGLYVRLWQLFRNLKPDIVHTRNLATLEAQLPALAAGVRCRIHGEHGRDVHDLDGTSRKYKTLRALFRPLVDQYIPLSRDLERYLTEDIGVGAGRITRICNGIDTQRFLPARDTRTARVSFSDFDPADSIVVGTVGRMEPVKDQLTLVQAFISLVDTVANGRERLRLIMVGDGSLRPEVENLLAQAGASHLAWLPGSRNDVEAFMQSMDIFVLPSLAEGISNTILEAMATGLPIVATDVGGNNELVTDGETGYLVPRRDPTAMASAIARYVENPALREKHGVAARGRIEREFSIEGMVQKYLEVYDEVVRRKKRQAPLQGDLSASKR